MHLLLALARSWPKLIRLWYRTEVIFLRKPYYAKGMTLKWRLRIVGFTILGLALSIKYFILMRTIIFNFHIYSRTHVLHCIGTFLGTQAHRDM